MESNSVCYHTSDNKIGRARSGNECIFRAFNSLNHELPLLKLARIINELCSGFDAQIKKRKQSHKYFCCLNNTDLASIAHLPLFVRQLTSFESRWLFEQQN